MRKFIITCCVLVALALGGAYLYLYQGVSFGLDNVDPSDIQVTFTQEDKLIYRDLGDGPEPFEIKGVDLGSGQPGNFASDYAISKETYLRWFEQIKELGANSIRVYIVQGTDFYEALYEFNKDNPDPLYLIQGVWLSDYANNSRLSAFDSEYLDVFKEDVRTTIDVCHGKRPFQLGRLSGTGIYTKDISPWVIGYLLGTQWEPSTVYYTDLIEDDRSYYSGKYLYTTADATSFEMMLAEVGDEALSYETARYHEQRLIAFSNWPETDPNEFPEIIQAYFSKYASIDVESIQETDFVKSGMFASYHVYPYHPDFLRYIDDYATQVDSSGNVNTYYTYLKLLNEHHAIPLVISEFGVPSSRGRASWDQNTYRNQGGMNEHQQALAIAQCYKDIKDAGCAGCIIFEWQDEWYRHSWNTRTNVDLLKAPYWSDYQTDEQSFGLLAFDPGEERSVSYVDGDLEEWTSEDVIGENEGLTLSMKYDEKFVYFLVKGDDVRPDTPIYLPIDTTQKSGSLTADALEGKNPELSFTRAADFLLVIDGEENTRILVQERSEVLRATELTTIAGVNPYEEVPAKDSSVFKPIYLMLNTVPVQLSSDDSGSFDELSVDELGEENQKYTDIYETGLLTAGNANPSSEDFNSLADFAYGDGFVEVKLPWQLLNFSNPSEMQIHDDYYENYGVDNQTIDSMWVGIGKGSLPIELFELELEPWGEKVTYHERLKESYYTMQSIWTGEATAEEVLEAAKTAGTDIASAEPIELYTYKELYYPDSQTTFSGPIDDFADRIALGGA